MQDVTYELKYCERCGSLGLRRVQSGESYCEPCGQILTSYSLPHDPRRRSLPRKPKSDPATPLKLESATEFSSLGRQQ